LLVYTDGVVDARDSQGRRYTLRRLRRLLCSPVESADELLDRIEDSLRRHGGTPEQFDDITLLAMRRTED
jgi:serine phosphatase RsbU (regulator of sigma subunit)